MGKKLKPGDAVLRPVKVAGSKTAIAMKAEYRCLCGRKYTEQFPLWGGEVKKRCACGKLLRLELEALE